MDSLDSELFNMGGQPLQTAVKGQMGIDGGAEMLSKVAGMPQPQQEVI